MRYGIEFRQTHDPHGRPEARTTRLDLPDRSHVESALTELYRVVRGLEPTRTGRPGEYWYRDPQGARGTFLVLGLGPHELPRVEERVQLHELERAIGMRDPFLWDRHSAGNARIWRNPWVSTGLGAAFALGGASFVAMSLGRLGDPGRDPAADWVGLTVGFLIAGAGVALALLHVRRLQWWTRARAAVKAAGLPMPSDLDPFA